MDDFPYLSQIRIGNRVIYNGVNGDAFSFGENPSTVADICPNNQQQSTCNSHTTNSLSDNSSSNCFKEELGTMVLNVAKVPETTLLQQKGCEQQIQKRSTLLSLANEVVSEQSNNDQFRLNFKSDPPLPSISTPPHMSLSPAAVGMPPILPPPPAAHLPPPLPSRPPSAVPSPASSISSLLSLKCDDRLITTPPPSPTQSSEIKTVNEISANNNNLRNFFFRSSGTIKVEEPSKDHQSPSYVPLSPPPLPLPIPTMSPTLSSSSITGANVSKSNHVSERRDSLKATVGLFNSSINHAMSVNNSSTPFSQRDSEEEDADRVDGKDETDISPTTVSSTPPASTGELVATRDGEKVFAQKKTKSTAEKNEVSRNIIPPEFDSIRKQSMTYADVISSVLMFYKLSTGTKKKKIPYVPAKLDKSPQCRKCGRQFGFRCFRYHCSRCKKSFCDTCTPVIRVDILEQGDRASSMSRVCDICSEEIAFETSRGTYRGLWSEFKTMRDEARSQRGLDVTSSTIHKPLESQTMLDVTPGLLSLCLRFLVDVHHQLEKQPRHKFLANYLHFENPAQSKMKGKTVKHKECQSCKKQLRMLTDIRDCSLCEQTFCMNCTYRTLQLYLPSGTDLKGDIHLDWIKFHVKDNEQDDAEATEASETYRVCADCEDVITRNLKIYEFNQKIPDLEAEMFDLQRQIDHALTYATNIKLANRLYDRYMRAYDILYHMEPQTAGQKALHKHIKQAMYDFYLKRRNQLKSTLRRRDSWTNASEMP